MSLQVVTVVCFTAVVSVVVALVMVVRDLVTVSGRRGGALALRSRAFWDAPPSDTLTGRLDLAFDRLMWETGWELAPLTGFLVLLASGLFSGGVAGLYFDEPLAGIIAGALGMTAALVVFLVQRYRRMTRMANDLPHLLDLLSRAVQAGRSIDQAVHFAGKEMSGPLGVELARCSRHLEMGGSVSATMESLAKRVRLSELRMLASVMTVHRRSGGHLPTALDRMSAVARTRLNYKRQMKTSTAAARLSAMIIAVLAPILFAVFLVVQPQHIRVLMENPTGQTLLCAAAVLQIVGLLWVARLIRSEED